jgi:hypothetical protein
LPVPVVLGGACPPQTACLLQTFACPRWCPVVPVPVANGWGGPAFSVFADLYWRHRRVQWLLLGGLLEFDPAKRRFPRHSNWGAGSVIGVQFLPKGTRGTARGTWGWLIFSNFHEKLPPESRELFNTKAIPIQSKRMRAC